MIQENLLRRIYYKLPPQLRLLARRLVYLPKDIFRKRNQLVPPEGLIYTGRGDFLKVGRYWLDRFVNDGGLQPDHSVLDIGSGIGRMALPLTQYLSSGKYEGFDAVFQGVKWCRDNIQKKYPNFNFKYIDLNNDLYKSSGIDATGYRFDYPDHSFDFIFAISVFTHMIDTEVDNYIKEASRVIKQGGKLFATFFIVDEDYSPANQRFSFPYDRGHYLLMDVRVRSANVAYRLSYIRRLAEQYGFSVELTEKGYWQNEAQQENNDFQDVIILKKH